MFSVTDTIYFAFAAKERFVVVKRLIEPISEPPAGDSAGLQVPISRLLCKIKE